MDDVAEDPDWDALLAARGGGAVPGGALPKGALPRGALWALFAPVLAPAMAADGCTVVGRLAQTLDGRIATLNGSSQWIGGPGDLLHTHRLRALCDAVLVGAGTVAHDDPRLTTRLVRGPNPVRVVLDPDRRLADTYRVFTDDAAPTLLIAAIAGAAMHGKAKVIELPAAGGGVDIPALLRRLAAQGLSRVFVEGGGRTVSAFLAAGCIDRLHLTIAPVILGSGIPAFSLPKAERIEQGLRFRWTAHPLGEDMLFDVALDRARPGVCAPRPMVGGPHGP